ncbi:MAG TPA: cell division protein FtsQ/DivIB [Xenococcaceae cyanobacterium]|jgi:cell division protein FtsQ
MAAPSFPQLESKIALLKQQQHKLRQRFLWRSLLVSSLAGSILAFAIIPHGKIKDPSQVQIKGTPLVAKTTIHHLLNIQYPEFIWQIPTQQLNQNLESIPPIVNARVNKQLFPPALQVFLAERSPVAVAISGSGTSLGFLDAQGVWLDPKYYEANGTKIALSELRVINFQPSYDTVWSEIYRLIQTYPSIKISEVRWDNSRNLYLKSELGTVYLGSDMSRLSEQFVAIGSLKNLPKHLKMSEIYYIDLTNPEQYSIQKYPDL